MTSSASSEPISVMPQPLGSWITGMEQIGGSAQKAVRTLERDLMHMGWPVGRYLGTIAQVQQSLGLGRPASREAITILEARGLIQTRRGPGGGIFVAIPSLEDITQMLLIYLEISGTSHQCIGEFRCRIWRMIVEAAIKAGGQMRPEMPQCEWGFAYNLATSINKPAMAFVAQLAEMIATTDGLPASPHYDHALALTISSGDFSGAMSRVDAMALADCRPVNPNAHDAAPLPSSTKGKPASNLAMRLVRELVERPQKLESEWETAERFECTEILVRQARRILEDNNLVHCRRGSKGAVLSRNASPSSLIRILAPCLIARGSLASNREVAYYLASDAAYLAAKNAKTSDLDRLLDQNIESENHSAAIINSENLLLDISGNPLLAIIVRSLGLANLHTGEAMHWGHGLQDILDFNSKILSAVLAGQAEAAGGIARCKASLIQSRLNRDYKTGSNSALLI